MRSTPISSTESCRRPTPSASNLRGVKYELNQRALLFTLVAVAAIRHAWRCWAEGDGASPLSECVNASFAEVYRITRRND